MKVFKNNKLFGKQPNSFRISHLNLISLFDLHKSNIRNFLMELDKNYEIDIDSLKYIINEVYKLHGKKYVDIFLRFLNRKQFNIKLDKRLIEIGHKFIQAVESNNLVYLKELIKPLDNFDKKIIFELIKHKGFNALHHAVSSSDISIIKFILDNGADIDAITDQGFTPLVIATLNKRVNVATYLIKEGANLNFVSKANWSLIHYASYFNCPRLVKIYLKYDLPINLKTNLGQTALHWAAAGGFKQVIKYLVKAKANVNLQDNDGNTPFHYAVWHNHINIVKYLLQHGGDLSIKNKEGLNVYDMAVSMKRVEIINELKKYKQNKTKTA